MPLPVGRATIWEDCGLTCLARIVGASTSAIAAADVGSYVRKVFVMGSTAALQTVTTTAPSTSAIHSLKTDGRWLEDSVGFNFTDTVKPTTTVFAKRDKCYRVEYAFTPASTSDAPYKAVFEVNTENAKGS